MTKFFLIFALVLLGVYPLEAQSQPGSVEIAKQAEVTDTLPGGGVDCLEKSSKTLLPEKAAEFCIKLAEIEAKRSAKVANEAADATKASRPVIVVTDGWYGSRYPNRHYRDNSSISWGVRIGSDRPRRVYNDRPRTSHRRNNN